MKKTVAIALLFVHLFNAGGYMLLFEYLMHRSNTFAEQQISKGLYNVHDLVEMKVPVHLSQVQNWVGYEPISGQVQLQGDSYNYVKLKVTRDTLYIICVPNYRTTKLNHDNIIYAKQVSDVPLNKKGNTNLIKTASLHIYYHLTTNYCLVQPPATIIKAIGYFSIALIPKVLTNTIDQPPQLCS